MKGNCLEVHVSLFNLILTSVLTVDSIRGHVHPYPYYFPFSAVPFNHLTSNFNPIQHIFASPQFYPQEQHWLQTPQFYQNQTNKEVNNQTPQDQGARSFQQYDIADIRARLLQQQQTQANNNNSRHVVNNGSALKYPGGHQEGPMRTSVDPQNLNVNNVITPNNFNNVLQQHIPNNIPLGFGNFEREQQNELPTRLNANNNLPNHNFPWSRQNAGWGWEYNLPPLTTTQIQADSGIVAPPMVMNESDMTSKERNSKSTRMETTTTTSTSTPTPTSKAIGDEANNEIELSNAVAKFRRIVTQIRDLTRKELRS